ncbi:MAG: hypothetical protein ACTSO9_02695 [Candidatus Helarchaeota archaeon]
MYLNFRPHRGQVALVRKVSNTYPHPIPSILRHAQCGPFGGGCKHLGHFGPDSLSP